MYGEPGRDPRGWVISSTYMALMNAGACSLKAGDDAQDARWFTVELTEVLGTGEEIAKMKLKLHIKSKTGKDTGWSSRMQTLI